MARQLDDYKPLAFYKKHTKAKQSGFSKFSEGGEHFFCRYVDGGIGLISESYTSERGRDNGVESVKKNEKIKAHVKVEQRAGSKWGVSIIAGNRQEVAVSPDLSSKAKAEYLAGRLLGTVKAKKAAAKPAAKAPRKGNVEQNYKPLAFYERQTKGKTRGIESFHGDDGEHYFAYFDDGKIALISEGYPTTAARDVGIASVEKNITNEKRYKYRGPLKKSKKYDFSLRAGNNKEIARSVWYGSAAAAATGAAYLMGKRKHVAPQLVDKADDYLPCDAYRGHAVNDKINNVALFKHRNGQFYFALYDENGDVRLRSEGFLTANNRDQELSGVLRLKDNPDYYKRIYHGENYIDVLYDETGREVGRSCLCKPKPAAVAPVPAPAPTPEPVVAGPGIWGWLKWLLLALAALLLAFFLMKSCKAPELPPVPVVTCWDGSEAENQAACPIKVTCWDGSDVKDAASCPVEPAPTVETFTCWDGSTVEDLATCPAEPVVTCWDGSEVKDAANCPAKPQGRECGYSDNVMFNTSGMTPRNVSYLGSNPQFGNSESLTPQGFFQKLQTEYEYDMRDRAFLNLMARSLGYGSFRDMDASMFSNDTLTNGSTGLLGVGEKHMLQFSTINTTDAGNLEAFRVKSANGVDVHFMKRCGNYMYVCNP